MEEVDRVDTDTEVDAVRAEGSPASTSGAALSDQVEHGVRFLEVSMGLLQGPQFGLRGCARCHGSATRVTLRRLTPPLP